MATEKFSGFPLLSMLRTDATWVGLYNSSNYRMTVGDGIADTYGNQIIGWSSESTSLSDAINYVEMVGTLSGSAAKITSKSSATNCDLEITTQGTGVINLSPNSGAGYVTINDSQDISSISNDTTLASDSAYILPTQHAVKTYVDTSVSGAALTRTNDTNVTLTLGGSPTTCLLDATSLTLGWTGTLDSTRLNSNVVQSVTNDTNVTGTISSQNLTLGWTGVTSVARGGTNSSTALSNGYLMASVGGSIVEISADSSANGKKITNLATPTSGSDAANKSYVDFVVGSGLTPVGNWDASTNTPTLTAGVGTVGNYYYVSVAGSQTLPSGTLTAYEVGDWVYYGSDAIWNKIDKTLGVQTLNGASGFLTLSGDGTGNQVSVGTSGTTITLTLPQNIGTSNSPTFSGLTLSGLTASYAVVTDGSKALSSLQYTNSNTASTLVQRDASGDFSAGTITASLSGNATTATSATTATTATSATTATNLASGAANQIPYQTASGATSFISAGASGVLVTNGSNVPSISSTLPSGLSIPSPSLTTPSLGTPSSGVLSSCTGTGGLRSVQIFTSGSGTYTKPSNVTSILVEVIGGGGGGGGSTSGASQVGVASGGGGGGYARLWIPSASSTYSYAVGSGGAGGVGGANGTAGGTTTFGASLQATGGTGGTQGIATSTGSAYQTAGVAGGIGSNGNLNVRGGASTFGMYITNQSASGNGGSSMYGGGAPGIAATTGNGNSGGDYGGGGSGAISSNNTYNGGAGAGGLIIVSEFS